MTLVVPVSRIQRNVQLHEAWPPAVKDKTVNVSAVFSAVPFHLPWWFKIKNWAALHVLPLKFFCSASVACHKPFWSDCCSGACVKAGLCSLPTQEAAPLCGLQLSWCGVVLVLLLFKWKPFVVLQFPNNILTLKTCHGRMWNKWMGWNT